jgi:hypothetical protein
MEDSEKDPAERFAALRRRQAGAFSRAHANEHGLTDRVLARWCRWARIQRAHHGVYVDFTGPMPWETRVWAAWLACGSAAALSGETALRQLGVEGDWRDEVVQLDIPHSRRLAGQPGIDVRRCRDFQDRLFGSREPPIVRVEVAVLTAAAAQARPDRALSIVLDACRQRRTTPERLLDELASMPRLPGRQRLIQALDDAKNGATSFLESAYRHQVERRHGLPTGHRQVREVTTADTVYRDVEYDAFGLIVELDGRAGHEATQDRWRDLTRDNAAALDAKVTLRFGYQLIGDPCSAAALVAHALHARGWSGTPTRCSADCRADFGEPRTQAAGEPPRIGAG